jgi:hypothetical protein
MIEGLTLREYFAAHASEADIESMRDKIGRPEQVLKNPDTGWHQIIQGQLPPDWRAIARFMFADQMMEAAWKVKS